jgi:opacity protein-like surface antigen
MGIQYDWNKDVTVGTTYEYLDVGEAEIDQDGSKSVIFKI